MYLFRKQSNKADIKHIEDVHVCMLVYYHLNTCSTLYHNLLSQSHGTIMNMARQVKLTVKEWVKIVTCCILLLLAWQTGM